MADGHYPEHRESLWILVVSPAIWSAHFLLSYVTAAVFCARVRGDFAAVRTAIAVYTVVALVAIGAAGWRGLRRHVFSGANTPHDFDSPEARHRFLGFSVVLLSILSAIATVYVSLPAFFIGSCR